MGLLGDIYSTIDSKKRQLKGLLSDPVETIRQGIQNVGQDWNGLLDTQAQAYPFIPRTQDQQARIPTFARTQKQARKELADQGANMGIAAATVWHGSPHKFDKFDSSKIGTGEGAQAYGHGLYFAESPDVAKAYRSNLVKDATFLEKKTGKVISKESPEYSDLLDMQARMERNGYGATFDKKYEVQDGAIYKVDLPDEAIAKMLDWDKPLSQQRPDVLKNFNDLYSLAKEKYVQNGGHGADWFGRGVDGMSAQLAYKSIMEDAVRAGLAKTPSEAANLLAKQGIPGIRYLDGGSRGTGTGTSNYVVFPGNEDILKILERNGQGLLGQ